MLEDRSINILAYNLETILAEKLETIIARASTNTRMRDFYDIHILYQLFCDRISKEDFSRALSATAKRRDSLAFIEDANNTLAEIAEDNALMGLWVSYQKKFSYAADINWDEVMGSVFALSGTN